MRRAVRAERTRLARELHDIVAQDLWRARLELEGLKSTNSVPDLHHGVDHVVTILGSALTSTREFIDGLREDDAGDDLATIVDAAAEDFTLRSGVRIESSIHPGSGRLPAKVATALSRIMREALSNVWKHSDATHVKVEALLRENWVHLTIADDGVGFKAHGESRGVGLASMRERAALVGGRVELESEPYRGTIVIVDIPVLS